MATKCKDIVKNMAPEGGLFVEMTSRIPYIVDALATLTLHMTEPYNHRCISWHIPPNVVHELCRKPHTQASKRRAFRTQTGEVIKNSSFLIIRLKSF